MMKKYLLIMLLVTSVTLVACDDQTEEYNKRIKFLDKVNDEYEKYGLIFESEEDKEYYLVKINNYQYNNLTLPKKEILNVRAKKFYKAIPGMLDIKEQILIDDEWIPIKPYNNYHR